MEFVIGQRWASNTESQLGLGIITDIEGRRLTISFPAAEETRTYALDNAPLSRIIYNPGDRVEDHDEQQFLVQAAQDLNGLYIYLVLDQDGQEVQLPEMELNCFVQFTTPQQRLFSGQFDKNRDFELRVATLNHLNRLQQSPVKGLLGSRTSLLAHQVYIASEVAQRFAPRVLLADEVGLGKTIEAGMILHHQIHTNQVQRCLILVPNSLVHQWLVEMLRKFNLSFSIFDASRIDAILNPSGEEEDLPEDTETINPFDTEQRIICNIDYLADDEKVQAMALATDWDMVIVDEAHHLHWSEQASSPEYQLVEQLAMLSKGLLLLTATPEQVGIDSHFARLRLLDPDRFHNLEAFRQEEQGYQPLNNLVQTLLSQDGQIEPEQRAQLKEYLGDQAEGNETPELIRQLLDRHGTGRVLFRNTRATIKGFPQRELHSYPLETPSTYQALLSDLPVDQRLYPEQQLGDEWLDVDPRVPWLVQLLKQHKGKKVLVICHHANTALALDKQLNLREGIRSTAFYEGLTIVERDRAAAYFADDETGAQTLICSEIGSEGRNFQFAHHLVLFDLPLNPDLLEQRIGRLDRIGQSQDIQIHAPYLQGTSQEILFRWYHQGVNQFEQSCAAGFAIHEHFEGRLNQQLLQPNDDLDALISETKSFTEQTKVELQQGRDPLLELNSCNPEIAQQLIDQIEDQEDFEQLQQFMEDVFSWFGVETEHHSDQTLVLRPSDHMRVHHFPGLKDEGNTITFDRAKALSREDMEFLSWEHPMVNETMDMIHTSELGNATLATISIKGLQPGTLLLEAVFAMQGVAAKHLQLERFLPLQPVRFLLDTTGKDLSNVVAHDKLNALCTPIKRHTAQAIVKQIREPVEGMLQRAKTMAEKQLPAIMEQANAQLDQVLGNELSRLKALREVNPAIREEEIQHLQQQIAVCAAYIEKASLELQAIRVVINAE